MTPRRLPKAAGRGMRLHPLGAVLAVVADAMGRGLVPRDHVSSSWDISGRCERPVVRQMLGNAARILGGRQVRAAGGWIHTLTLHTRCRRCAACLRVRSALWAARAREEIAAAPRTWFATFTLRPHEHFMVRAETSARLASGGVDFERLTPNDAAQELARTYNAHLTRYFKRLRKNTGVPLRYVLVQELHKSGLAHFHALIHEVRPDAQLRHAALTAEWTLGYTKFKLCEGSRTAWYVAKYLAKTVLSRVRASIGYGNHGLGHSELHSVMETRPPKRTQDFMGSIHGDSYVSNDSHDRHLQAVRRVVRDRQPSSDTRLEQSNSSAETRARSVEAAHAPLHGVPPAAPAPPHCAALAHFASSHPDWLGLGAYCPKCFEGHSLGLSLRRDRPRYRGGRPYCTEV